MCERAPVRHEQLYVPLLVRALLLALQLFPVLFITDILLTAACSIVTTAFTLINLDDTTWLDTALTCSATVLIDVVAKRSQQSSDAAPPNAECTQFYDAVNLQFNGHLLLTLARAIGSLVCWCALFAALAWMGATKARLLRRVTSKCWWRATRALFAGHKHQRVLHTNGVAEVLRMCCCCCLHTRSTPYQRISQDILVHIPLPLYDNGSHMDSPCECVGGMASGCAW